MNEGRGWAAFGVDKVEACAGEGDHVADGRVRAGVDHAVGVCACEGAREDEFAAELRDRPLIPQAISITTHFTRGIATHPGRPSGILVARFATANVPFIVPIVT